MKSTAKLAAFLEALISRPIVQWSFEILAPLLVVGVQLVTLREVDAFQMRSDGAIRWPAIMVAVSPVMTFYLLLRFFAPALLSAVIAGSLSLVLSIGSALLLSKTNNPLSWAELSATTNISVVAHYITLHHVLLLVVVAILCWLAVKLNPFRRVPLAVRMLQFSLALAASLLAFHPYIGSINAAIGESVASVVRSTGVMYKSWDWPANVKHNGLLIHLMYTSNTAIPPEPTDLERAAYRKLEQPVAQSKSLLPANVIVIMCESCWHDDEHFSGNFSALRDAGFRDFRATSPVYGGRTANAEFEILTGLPSLGPLTGVIYQEYAELISGVVETYARSFQEAGYRSTAAHNHDRRFWRRDIVLPKFGFEQFLGIGDMDYDGEPWADDSVLFDAMLEVLSTRPVGNFFFLTTVYTHGDYPFNGDFGEADFQSRQTTTISRIAAFADAVKAIEPNTVVVMVGDHKPALNRFFYETGVIPKDNYRPVENGTYSLLPEASQEIVGDVPGYIYHPDSDKVAEFVRSADRLPFFCTTHVLNRVFLGLQLPSYSYAEEQSLCSSPLKLPYQETVQSFPVWLYSLSVFGDV